MSTSAIADRRSNGEAGADADADRDGVDTAGRAAGANEFVEVGSVMWPNLGSGDDRPVTKPRPHGETRVAVRLHCPPSDVCAAGHRAETRSGADIIREATR